MSWKPVRATLAFPGGQGKMVGPASSERRLLALLRGSVGVPTLLVTTGLREDDGPSAVESRKRQRRHAPKHEVGHVLVLLGVLRALGA